MFVEQKLWRASSLCFFDTTVLVSQSPVFSMILTLGYDRNTTSRSPEGSQRAPFALSEPPWPLCGLPRCAAQVKGAGTSCEILPLHPHRSAHHGSPLRIKKANSLRIDFVNWRFSFFIPNGREKENNTLWFLYDGMIASYELFFFASFPFLKIAREP
jgi:hypothetical protein